MDIDADARTTAIFSCFLRISLAISSVTTLGASLRT